MTVTEFIHSFSTIASHVARDEKEVKLNSKYIKQNNID